MLVLGARPGQPKCLCVSWHAIEFSGEWQIQVRSGNCVCPIMMDDCKCGKTITHCVVVTPLSPVNGSSVSRFFSACAIIIGQRT